jgi:hypothetical protein
MKTSSCKAKGRNLQKYICKVITKIFKLGEGDVISRSMGSQGTDCHMSPKARLHFPFSIECKNTKLFPSIAALAQSKANVVKGTLPGVVWKPPGKGMDQSIIYFNFQEFAEFWAEHMGFPQEKTDNNLPDRDFEIAQEWSRLDAKS